MPDIPFAFVAGLTLLDGPPANVLVRLAVDVVCAAVLVRGVYYRHYQRSDLFLTFFAFNLAIFLITFLLNRVEMTIGAAFGLFAVFSMLRYRTENLSARDMTYLFLVIALGLITSVAPVGWAPLAVIGGMVPAAALLLESNLIARRADTQRVDYEKLSLIDPRKRDELLADLRTRTGLDVYRVDVDNIDFVRDTARLTVYYYET